MGESNEMDDLSVQTKNRIPRDLLQRFTLGTTAAGPPGRSDPEDDLGSGSGEELELNLGLSLGGRFGVDKSNSRLIRSSSIAVILPVVRDDDVLGSSQWNTGPGRAYSSLMRTSSQPVETEEEWRKRKQLQSLRRLAAKRRRSEKQRNSTSVSLAGSSAEPPFRSNKRTSSGATDAYSGGGSTVATGGATKGGGGGLSSQGSMPEFDSRHRQGSSGSYGETSLLQEQKNQESVNGSSNSNTPTGRELNSSSKNQGKEIVYEEHAVCVHSRKWSQW